MRSLVLALAVPVATALATALLRDYPRLERTVALGSTLGLTVWTFFLLGVVETQGVVATVLGGWDAPWGIALAADRLSALMLCVSMTVASVVVVYTTQTATDAQQRAFFTPLMQLTIAGVNWSFVTGDLFNLFVAYEVMLVASYGMLLVGAGRAQVRQAFQYIALNQIGSVLFVVACGLVYASAGTLNLADLAVRTAQLTGDRASLVTAASMLLLVVFALKSATFPLIYWLPDAYPAVPPGVVAYFAGLLTKVGVYSLLRVLVMSFRQDGAVLALDVLLVLSGLTMFLGVMGAMCQWDVRRILSWHIISQVGYMVMGIGLAGRADARVFDLAIAGTILHVVHNAFVKSCLFLSGGVAERVVGSQALRRMGGVLALAPGAAAVFFVAAMSISGMPPLSGFVSKLVLVRAGIEAGRPVLVTVAIVTSFFTLYSMTKIWRYAFWRAPMRERPAGAYRSLLAPTAVLAVASVVLGVGAQPLVAFAGRAAASLRDPSQYVRVVLGAQAELAHRRARVDARTSGAVASPPARAPQAAGAPPVAWSRTVP